MATASSLGGSGGMATEDIDDIKFARLYERMKRFILQDRPLPLSPLWERFMVDFLLPAHQSYPARAAAGKTTEVGQERRAMYQRSCELGPFDFTDDRINMHRARNFLALLDDVRDELGASGHFRRQWWPASRTALVTALIAERSGGQTGGVSSSSGSRNEKNEARRLAPVAPRRHHAPVPTSSSKRDADTWSTTATTGSPRVGSSSRGKSKRQRRS